MIEARDMRSQVKWIERVRSLIFLPLSDSNTDRLEDEIEAEEEKENKETC